MQVLRVLHTGAEPEVQAGELPVLLREQVPERVREQVLRLPSADFRNRRRRLNLQDFLYHKWDKTYYYSAFLREPAGTRLVLSRLYTIRGGFNQIKFRSSP